MTNFSIFVSRGLEHFPNSFATTVQPIEKCLGRKTNVTKDPIVPDTFMATIHGTLTHAGRKLDQDSEV